MSNPKQTDNKEKHLGQKWPALLRERLEAWANRRGVSMSAAILTIVADRLDADEVKL